MLNGVFVRRGLKTSDYEIALKKVRAWEAEGSAREAQTRHDWGGFRRIHARPGEMRL